MTFSQYLGRGSTSRGRAVIAADLSMSPNPLPYLHTPGDIYAVVQGIANMQAILNKVPGLTWLSPAKGADPSAYVANYSQAVSDRTANHWIGTAKLGTDDGRQTTNGKLGTAVVDLNTKVYGTDNLFVVDASILSAAEHASEKILALAAPSPVAKYGQCGGSSWTGSFICAAGSTCTYSNVFYSQCL